MLDFNFGLTKEHSHTKAHGAQRHHSGQIAGIACSPCGNFLATGSIHGGSLEAGHLLLLDLCEGTLMQAHAIEGGVGWPDEVGALHWRPDGGVLGLAYATNAIGLIDPFDPDAEVTVEWRVTGGWPNPPQWIWSPDRTQTYVACWGPGQALGAFLQVDQPEAPPRWAFSAPDLDTLSQLAWKAPVVLTGWSSHRELVGLDTTTGDHLWTHEVSAPLRFGADGAPILLPNWCVEREAEALIPSPDGRRLAALVSTEATRHAPGVSIYEGDAVVVVLPAELPKEDLYHDAPRFAWSPDGRRGALWRADGVLELWDLDGVVERKAEVAVEGVRGVFYGANIALVGESRIVFVRPDGQQIAAYDNAEPVEEDCAD